MQNKYSAVVLHKSLGSRGRASGNLYFTYNSICFSNDSITKELPTQGLSITLGEGGQKLYYFTHSSIPEWSFTLLIK